MANRERTCMTCRKKAEKSGLLRIVSQRGGSVALDLTGNAAGRGAYACSSECLRAACESKRLASALRRNIPNGFWESIADEVDGAFSCVEAKE